MQIWAVLDFYGPLKGRFSSGLEGTSAIKKNNKIGDLTGKQLCVLMHNNHNQMKIIISLREFSFKMAAKSKDKVQVKHRDPRQSHLIGWQT